MPIRAAVFDFYNTLARVDAEARAADADEFGLTRDEVVTATRGGAGGVAPYAGGPFGIAEIRAAMITGLPARLGARVPEAADRLMRVYTDAALTIPIAGMVAVLRELQTVSVPVGILSNGPREATELMSAVLGDALPGTVVTSGATGVRKPQPAAFEGVAQALGYPVAECVFIDDSAENVEGARAVGMPALHFDGDSELIRAEMHAVGLLQRDPL